MNTGGSGSFSIFSFSFPFSFATPFSFSSLLFTPPLYFSTHSGPSSGHMCFPCSFPFSAPVFFSKSLPLAFPPFSLLISFFNTTLLVYKFYLIHILYVLTPSPSGILNRAILSPGNRFKLAPDAALFGGRPLRHCTLCMGMLGNPSLVLAIELPVIHSKGFRFSGIFVDFLFKELGP